MPSERSRLCSLGWVCPRSICSMDFGRRISRLVVSRRMRLGADHSLLRGSRPWSASESCCLLGCFWLAVSSAMNGCVVGSDVIAMLAGGQAGGIESEAEESFSLTWLAPSLHQRPVTTASFQLSARLRSAYLASIVCQDASYADTHGAGEIAARVGKDATTVRTAFGEKIAYLIWSASTLIAGVIVSNDVTRKISCERSSLTILARFSSTSRSALQKRLVLQESSSPCCPSSSSCSASSASSLTKSAHQPCE